MNSQRSERNLGQPPSRIRRISLLPTSITSASLSFKPRPSSSFALPSSSPRGSAKKQTLDDRGPILKRRTSCSTLPGSTLAFSSTLGRRRVNVTPQDKGKPAGVIKEPAGRSPPFVSEFGAIQHVSLDDRKTASPRASKIPDRHGVSRHISNSSNRQSTLPARAGHNSLRPSTAGGIPNLGQTSFPMKAAVQSNIPRPRIGSSTPTRSTIIARKSFNTKASASIADVGKSPSFQIKPLASQSNAANVSSVKSRAGMWGRLNASCSSPSPSPRHKVNLQGTPTLKAACDSKVGMIHASQTQSSAQPELSRRTRLKPQSTELQQCEPALSRHSSLIDVIPDTVHVSKANESSEKADGEEDWGRWKAGTPAQCDDKEEENVPSEGRSHDEEESRESLCTHDFINASVLMDGKMLDELDAELGRLGLDESTTAINLEGDKIEDQNVIEMEKIRAKAEEDRRKHETIVTRLEQQRDDAIQREYQTIEALIAAESEIELYKAAVIEAERDMQRKEEALRQKERAKVVVKIVEGIDSAQVELLQRQAEKNKTIVTTLGLESVSLHWKHLMELSGNHQTSLESQLETCSILFTQLEILQRSISTSI